MIDWVHSIGNLWADNFLLMALQNSFFMLFVLLLLYLFRNHNAKFLRLIAIAGIIKLLIPPFLSIPSFVNEKGLALINSLSLPLESVKTTNTVTIGSENTASLLNIFASQSLWMGLWLMFAILLFSCALVHTTIRNRKILKYAIPVPSENVLPQKYQDKIFLLKSDFITSPVLIGLFHPKIILPVNWEEWDLAMRRSVITHELTHARHLDHWLNYFVLAAKSLHFYNPLVWILSKKFYFYKELACDEQAISETNITPMHYSQSLLTIAEKTMKKHASLVNTFAWYNSKKLFSQRIYHLLSYKKNQDTPALKSVNYVTLFVMVSLFIPFSLYNSDILRGGSEILQSIRNGQTLKEVFVSLWNEDKSWNIVHQGWYPEDPEASNYMAALTNFEKKRSLLPKFRERALVTSGQQSKPEKIEITIELKSGSLTANQSLKINRGEKVSVTMYDKQGKSVKKIINNIAFHSSKKINWDWVGDDKEPLDLPGTYVIVWKTNSAKYNGSTISLGEK